MKYLVVLLVVAVAVGLWRSRRRQESDREERVARHGARGGRLAAPERMVACAHCGLNLPASDAQDDGQGHWFCSRQHARQFAARARP